MTAFHDRIAAELADIDAQGLTKPERIIASRQGPLIEVGGREVLNFCANNYLGLAGDERVVQAGIKAQERWGAGTASVRFICGTLEIHKELERAIADYLGFEDTILFAAAFDANGGIFDVHLHGAVANGWRSEIHVLEWLSSQVVYEGLPLVEDGRIMLSDRPGVGMTWREDAVREFAVD